LQRCRPLAEEQSSEDTEYESDEDLLGEGQSAPLVWPGV
jgi:hypothetical protein